MRVNSTARKNRQSIIMNPILLVAAVLWAMLLLGVAIAVRAMAKHRDGASEADS
jgi:hypothetical protein